MFGDDAADNVFDPLSLPFRSLESRSRRRFETDDELTGIGAWKERQSHQRKETQGDKNQKARTTENLPWPLQNFSHQAVVAVEHGVEASSKCCIEARPQTVMCAFRVCRDLLFELRRLMHDLTMRAFDEASTEERHYGQRDEI